MLLKIFAALIAILIIIYSVGAFYILPEFEKVWDGFDIELPLLTKLLIVSYPYWLAMLIIPFIIYRKYLTKIDLSKKIKTRILFLFIVMLIFSVLFFPALIAIIYLPVFEMAAENI